MCVQTEVHGVAGVVFPRQWKACVITASIPEVKPVTDALSSTPTLASKVVEDEGTAAEPPIMYAVQLVRSRTEVIKSHHFTASASQLCSRGPVFGPLRCRHGHNRSRILEFALHVSAIAHVFARELRVRLSLRVRLHFIHVGECPPSLCLDIRTPQPQMCPCECVYILVCCF
jgi:hypothetical protein